MFGITAHKAGLAGLTLIMRISPAGRMLKTDTMNKP